MTVTAESSGRLGLRPKTGVAPLLSRALIALAAATVLARLGGLWWPFELVSHFTVQILALQLLLAAVLGWQRRTSTVLLSLPFLLMNLLMVGAYYVAPPAPTVAGGAAPTHLRVMTVNLRHDNRRADLVEELVQREDPDVILFIEPTGWWYEALASVRSAYPHSVWELNGSGAGIMLVSRLRWSRASTVYIGTDRSPSVQATICPRPPAGAARRCIEILGIHPVRPLGQELARDRDRQLAAVAAYVQRRRIDDLVVMGDLNATPWSPRFREFLRDSGLADSAQGHGVAATWWSRWPLFGLPIDHILPAPGVGVTERYIGRDIGSDHYPVVADIEF